MTTVVVRVVKHALASARHEEEIKEELRTLGSHTLPSLGSNIFLMA
jgi:hypothetical protein